MSLADDHYKQLQAALGDQRCYNPYEHLRAASNNLGVAQMLSVRLCDEDIERIADAVVRKLKP